MKLALRTVFIFDEDDAAARAREWLGGTRIKIDKEIDLRRHNLTKADLTGFDGAVIASPTQGMNLMGFVDAWGLHGVLVV
jgi:hypothetical protein